MLSNYTSGGRLPAHKSNHRSKTERRNKLNSSLDERSKFSFTQLYLVRCECLVRRRNEMNFHIANALHVRGSHSDAADDDSSRPGSLYDFTTCTTAPFPVDCHYINAKPLPLSFLSGRFFYWCCTVVRTQRPTLFKWNNNNKISRGLTVWMKRPESFVFAFVIFVFLFGIRWRILATEDGYAQRWFRGKNFRNV